MVTYSAILCRFEMTILSNQRIDKSLAQAPKPANLHAVSTDYHLSEWFDE